MVSTEAMDMRRYTTNTFGWIQQNDKLKQLSTVEDIATTGVEILTISSKKPLSSREQHEIAHWASLRGAPNSKFVYNTLKKVFRSRVKEGYLFNCGKNQKILAEDPWLQDVWVWIEGSLN